MMAKACIKSYLEIFSFLHVYVTWEVNIQFTSTADNVQTNIEVCRHIVLHWIYWEGVVYKMLYHYHDQISPFQ